LSLLKNRASKWWGLGRPGALQTTHNTPTA
jgi:hypothetical protein